MGVQCSPYLALNFCFNVFLFSLFFSAMGTAYTRAQWSGVIAALEADKLVSTARDGGPVLTRKGKSALSQPADAFVAPKTIKDVLGNFEEGGNLLESVFG